MEHTSEEAKLIDSEAKLIAEFRAKFVEPIDKMARALNLNGDAYVMGKAEDVENFLLSTHRTAREEGRREVLEELKKELDGLVKQPTLCGKCNLAGKLCRECYANRRANSVLVECAALIDARIGK